MRSLTIIGLALALLMASAGQAVAQNEEAEEMLADFEESNGNGVLDEDIGDLTPEEMLERATDMVASMEVTLENTNELLAQARQEDRDILKINCINENLASIKGFVNVAEQSLEGLAEAVEVDNNEEAAEHHYTLISIAGQRVNHLGEQARVCAGEELRYAEDMVLEVDIDPDIGDPDRDFMEDEVLERLPEKTPYQ